MGERARDDGRGPFPRVSTFGTAAVTAQRQLSWLWTRESVLRLCLAFVLATALWLYVTSNQDPMLARDYGPALPVSATNVHEGLTVTNNLPTVHVRIRVDPATTPVSPASFHAFVDLSRLGAGAHLTVPVDVVADPGIDVVGVTPQQIPVVIESVQVRHVPVRWSIISQPPHGFNTGDIHVDPSTVTVSGPQSVVSQVAQATVYIYLSQARTTVQGTYKPSLVDSQGNAPAGSEHLLLDPAQVTVRVPIQARSNYKTVPVIVPVAGLPAAGIGVTGITIRPAEVTVHGSVSALSRISSISTKSVFVGRRKAGSFTVRVPIRVPAHLGTSSRYVTATVHLGPASSSASLEVNVVPLNVRGGLVTRVQPASVLVTLVGSNGSLSTVTSQTQAVVDLTGYGIGTFQIAPTVSAPAGARVSRVYPSTVTVQVLSPTT